jgi:hypothetical protein
LILIDGAGLVESPVAVVSERDMVPVGTSKGSEVVASFAAELGEPTLARGT